MTVVLVVLALVAVVAFEVRADRKVKRSTAGATPVVIIRGLKPRWWRRLISEVVGAVLPLAALVALFLAALHIRATAPAQDPVHSWPMPSGTPSPTGPRTPTHGTPSPTSANTTPKGH